MTTTSQFRAIDVGGPDAVDFLQGQLTLDVSKLTPTTLSPGAWLNPKGRVITLLDAHASTAGVRLILPAVLVESVLKRLQMYRLRAAVSFDQQSVFPCLSDSPATAVATRWDPKNGQAEFYTSEPSTTNAAHSAWRLAFGLPAIDESNTEKFTAHQLNLDLLDAVAFDKGCYSGQEIVARTQHLGRVKRRTIRFVSEERADPADALDLSVPPGQGTGISMARREDQRLEWLVLSSWPLADRTLEDAQGRRFEYKPFSSFELPSPEHDQP